MDRGEFLRNLAAEAGRGELTFPTSAAVGLRVSQALDDPDCSSNAAVRLIKAEPMLSARVVAVANSAAFNRSGRVITDVPTAVTLLGFRTVRALATAMLARQMAGAPEPANRDLVARLWEHTAHVAALAQVIAKRVTRQDPDTAMFAGMVHEIGGFYLISRARDFPDLMGGEAKDWAGEDDAERADDNDMSDDAPEREIGRAVLKALSVPESVVAAIELLWKGYLAFPPATLGDTLLLADHLAPVKSPLFQTADKSHEGMASSIDMNIEQDTLVGILEASADEVKSLTDALRF